MKTAPIRSSCKKTARPSIRTSAAASARLRVYDTQPELLRGAEVCDTIVGKAAAAIYILAGASGVYAETMSAAAVDFLTANGVACACHTKTEKLLNRQGTGLCPFEQAVLELQKPEDCLPVIRQTLARLMAGKK